MDMGRYNFVLLCLIACISRKDAARILALPVLGWSHMIEQIAIGEELVERGHEVYMAVSYGTKNIHHITDRKLKAIHFQFQPDREPPYDFTMDGFRKVAYELAFGDIEASSAKVAQMIAADCVDMMADQQFISKLKSLNFDLSIVDRMFMARCLLLIPNILDIPYVTTSGHMDEWLARTPMLPSFAPSVYGFMPEKMSFWERLENLRLQVIAVRNLGHSDPQLEQHAPHFANWGELLDKSLVHFLFRSWLLEPPLPSMPKIIMTHGINRKPQHLPKELEDIMDAATQGVIIVTFGSMMDHFDDELFEIFKDAFGRMAPYRILWRYTDPPTGSIIPANTKVMSWLPQLELLAHTNTKLFVSHCGNNGLYESVSSVVPILCFPLWTDQIHNSERARLKGISLTLSIHNFTAEDLEDTMRQLIADPKFELAVKQMADVVHDAPMRPTEEVAFWIEHVMKYGADHLASYAEQLHWWQLIMLDILLFILGILVVIAIVVILLCRFMISLCRKRKIKLD